MRQAASALFSTKVTYATVPSLDQLLAGFRRTILGLPFTEPLIFVASSNARPGNRFVVPVGAVTALGARTPSDLPGLTVSLRTCRPAPEVEITAYFSPVVLCGEGFIPNDLLNRLLRAA